MLLERSENIGRVYNSILMASRQYKWQLKQKVLGNCIICGQKRAIISKQFCPHHVLVQRKKRLNKLNKNYDVSQI